MIENPLEKIETHIFYHPWRSVIQGFWTKYPNKQMAFVKFNHVIDFEIVDSNIITFKRLMHCKIPHLPLFSYSIEDIKIDLKEKVLEMKSFLIKKSKFFPFGDEYCKYLSQNKDGKDCTVYTKTVMSSNKISKFLGYFNKAFEKGCQIVEENTQKFEKNTI